MHIFLFISLFCDCLTYYKTKLVKNILVSLIIQVYIQNRLWVCDQENFPFKSNKSFEIFSFSTWLGFVKFVKGRCSNNVKYHIIFSLFSQFSTGCWEWFWWFVWHLWRPAAPSPQLKSTISKHWFWKRWLREVLEVQGNVWFQILKLNSFICCTNWQKYTETRQSSCVTARGVPPARPTSKSFQNVCPKFCPFFVPNFVKHFCPNLWGVPQLGGGYPRGCLPQFGGRGGGYPQGHPYCEQTNWKHYLPVILRMRVVISFTSRKMIDARDCYYHAKLFSLAQIRILTTFDLSALFLIILMVQVGHA